jgi:hypothetical protein
MSENIIQVEPAAVIPVKVIVTAFDCRANGEPYAERMVITTEKPCAKPLGLKHQLTVINRAVTDAYEAAVVAAAKEGKTVLGWRYEVVWSNNKRRIVV